MQGIGLPLGSIVSRTVAGARVETTADSLHVVNQFMQQDRAIEGVIGHVEFLVEIDPEDRVVDRPDCARGMAKPLLNLCLCHPMDFRRNGGQCVAAQQMNGGEQFRDQR